MLKVPLYAPGGLAAGVPTCSVPPMVTTVREGGVLVIINGADGAAVPILSVIDPPLLPVKVTAGPLRMDTMVPGRPSTSNRAGEKVKPRPVATTSPVVVRAPVGEITTEPPEAP